MQNNNIAFSMENAVVERETVHSSPASNLVFKRATTNPYEQLDDCPKDIFDYLLPDGSKFGLFSDPYATLNFYEPTFGLKNGRYWLDHILQGNDVSINELKLIELLSEHSCLTRKQIERKLFPDLPAGSRVGIDFIKKCRNKGILCAFNWNSPIKDERKKPLSYSLTQFSAQALEILLHRKVPKDVWLRPISFNDTHGPDMTRFFIDLVCNELFAEITRIDRLISWKRRPTIRANQTVYHVPAATFEVIKDKDQIFYFWVEVFRPVKDFPKKTVERFVRINQIYESLPDESRPARVILIADGDARIKDLDLLAKQYMPNIPVRYSTDERILKGLDKDTFLEYNHEKDVLMLSRISFLQEGAEGMTKTQLLEGAIRQTYDDFEE